KGEQESTPAVSDWRLGVGGLWPVVLVFLLAFALRVWNLTGIPPGLTHDEANHGREAIGVLNGVFLYFFPLNYGSEPLYSYTVALFMALLGKGVFALRLVNALFGTLAVAATYAWAAPRLGRRTALLGAALMAVSFWPVAASREALRAGMLPFFMTLAVIGFWRILEITNDESSKNSLQTTDHRPQERHPSSVVRRPSSPIFASLVARRSSLVILFGLAVALMLHVYLAARVSCFRRLWRIWRCSTGRCSGARGGRCWSGCCWPGR
ncbi:MAG TPA: glycosyltransferase family 39 protein, partial [Promineifilum sp.]|nr:glycosyltransferase family 39 protein [Promineifilum sp.]